MTQLKHEPLHGNYNMEQKLVQMIFVCSSTKSPSVVLIWQKKWMPCSTLVFDSLKLSKYSLLKVQVQIISAVYFDTTKNMDTIGNFWEKKSCPKN